MKTAPPHLVARVRALGCMLALNRAIEQCEREAERVRARGLRAAELDRRRPCERCAGDGWIFRVEPSPDGGLWCPLRWERIRPGRDRNQTMVRDLARPMPFFRDCPACRVRRLAVAAELAAAKHRADELALLAGAMTSLLLEILPEIERIVADSRREEWRAEKLQRVRATTRESSSDA